MGSSARSQQFFNYDKKMNCIQSDLGSLFTAFAKHVFFFFFTKEPVNKVGFEKRTRNRISYAKRIFLKVLASKILT